MLKSNKMKPHEPFSYFINFLKIVSCFFPPHYDMNSLLKLIIIIKKKKKSKEPILIDSVIKLHMSQQFSLFNSKFKAKR